LFARSRRSARLGPLQASVQAPAAPEKGAAAAEKKKKEVAEKRRALHLRNAGLVDFGGKGGLSSLNAPKDPKRVPVVKAVDSPLGETMMNSSDDEEEAPAPTRRLPLLRRRAPAPSSGDESDHEVATPPHGTSVSNYEAPTPPRGISVKVFLVDEPPSGRGPQSDPGAQFVTVNVPSNCTEDELKELVLAAVHAANRRLGYPALARECHPHEAALLYV